jgi:hypothetical protein
VTTREDLVIARAARAAAGITEGVAA